MPRSENSYYVCNLATLQPILYGGAQREPQPSQGLRGPYPLPWPAIVTATGPVDVFASCDCILSLCVQRCDCEVFEIDVNNYFSS